VKEKGISRDIGRSKRSAGESPGLGHVNKMPAQPQPSSRGERRRRVRSVDPERDGKSQDKHTKSALMMWSLAFGGIAFLVLGTFFFFLLKPHLERRQEMAETYKASTDYRVEPEVPAFEALGEQEAIKLVKEALKARSPADISAKIRMGDASVEQVSSFLNGMKNEDGEIDRFQWLSRLDTTVPGIEGVLVNFKKADKNRNRLALLVADKGEWKLDFPAFARLATPAWSELLDGQVESATVRVYAAADQYFNGPFADESQWKCFGIASPDVPDLLYGYCKVDSLQAQAIAKVLADKKMARVTVVLHRVEGAASRQYLIKRVLAEDWAVTDVAPDDR